MSSEQLTGLWLLIGTTWHTTGVLWRLRPGDTERETELLSSTWRLLHELECQPEPTTTPTTTQTTKMPLDERTSGSSETLALGKTPTRAPAQRHPAGPVAGARTGLVQNGGLFIASCPERLREYSRLVPVRFPLPVSLTRSARLPQPLLVLSTT